MGLIKVGGRADFLKKRLFNTSQIHFFMSAFSYLITRIFQPENSFAFFFILSDIFCYHHSLQLTFCAGEVCVNFDFKKRYIPSSKTEILNVDIFAAFQHCSFSLPSCVADFP